MIYKATWNDGASYTAGSPDELVEKMREAGQFVAGQSNLEYMMGVALRAGYSHGQLNTVNCDRFLRDLHWHNLITYEVENNSRVVAGLVVVPVGRTHNFEKTYHIRANEQITLCGRMCRGWRRPYRGLSHQLEIGPQFCDRCTHEYLELS